MPQPGTANGASAKTQAAGRGDSAEYPVREYIGSMAQELAQMARWDNDPVLADLLESAADHANGDRPA